MAGICSAHRHKQEGCRLCGIEAEAALPGFAEAAAAAEAAGKRVCACGYEHYKTADLCPRCGRAARDEGEG